MDLSPVHCLPRFHFMQYSTNLFMQI